MHLCGVGYYYHGKWTKSSSTGEKWTGYSVSGALLLAFLGFGQADIGIAILTYHIIQIIALVILCCAL